MMMNQQFPMGQGQQPGFPVQPIVCPTQYRYNDCYTPQEIPYIHPIVNVNRHHTVGVPQHYYTESTQDVMGQMIMPGFGPPGTGVGGVGTGMGPCRSRCGRKRFC